jgi:hypothetical protein
LVEDYPCLSLQQLDAREKYYINLDKNSINFRTKIGKHENKQFMQNLKQNNKNNNIEKKGNCECGSTIGEGSKSEHLKTRKHRNYIIRKKFSNKTT